MSILVFLIKVKYSRSSNCFIYAVYNACFILDWLFALTHFFNLYTTFALGVYYLHSYYNHRIFHRKKLYSCWKWRYHYDKHIRYYQKNDIVQEISGLFRLLITLFVKMFCRLSWKFKINLWLFLKLIDVIFKYLFVFFNHSQNLFHSIHFSFILLCRGHLNLFDQN